MSQNEKRTVQRFLEMWSSCSIPFSCLRSNHKTAGISLGCVCVCLWATIYFAARRYPDSSLQREGEREFKHSVLAQSVLLHQLTACPSCLSLKWCSACVWHASKCCLHGGRLPTPSTPNHPWVFLNGGARTQVLLTPLHADQCAYNIRGMHE